MKPSNSKQIRKAKLNQINNHAILLESYYGKIYLERSLLFCNLYNKNKYKQEN
jgi:hypothetical protein